MDSGGDPGLSPAGTEYARRLGVYSEHCIQTNPHTGRKVAARLWTSSLQRTELTAACISHPELDSSELEARTDVMEETGLCVPTQPAVASSQPSPPPRLSGRVAKLHTRARDERTSVARRMRTRSWKQMRQRVYRNLDEIYAGTYDGMTEEQIATADERFGSDRKVDKLATRYPHGESYLDLITRLEVRELSSTSRLGTRRYPSPSARMHLTRMDVRALTANACVASFGPDAACLRYSHSSTSCTRTKSRCSSCLIR